MNILPEELYGEILFFLSLKEKIRMRKVNSIFKTYVTAREVSGYKLENNFLKNNSIEQKQKNELVCEFVYDDFKLYKQPCIHYYYKIMGTYKKCITNCTAERLGYIYHSPRETTQHMCLYNKRYIPYCIHCFQKFQIKKIY